MLLTDTGGNKSLTHTLCIVAFIVVMVKVVIGGASVAIGGFSYSFGTIDSLSIAAILSPVLGAYVARRYTTANISADATTPDAGSKPADGAA